MTDYYDSEGCCLTCEDEDKSDRNGWNGCYYPDCLCFDCKCTICDWYNNLFYYKCTYPRYNGNQLWEVHSLKWKAKTEKAILFINKLNGEEFWLPKSQIEMRKDHIIVPLWLIDKYDLDKNTGNSINQ